MSECLMFGVSGLGFRVQDLGFFLIVYTCAAISRHQNFCCIEMYSSVSECILMYTQVLALLWGLPEWVMSHMLTVTYRRSHVPHGGLVLRIGMSHAAHIQMYTQSCRTHSNVYAGARAAVGLSRRRGCGGQFACAPVARWGMFATSHSVLCWSYNRSPGRARSSRFNGVLGTDHFISVPWMFQYFVEVTCGRQFARTPVDRRGNIPFICTCTYIYIYIYIHIYVCM